jgi:hypothetical protein
LATTKEDVGDWAEGGENGFVFLELALGTETVALGAVVLPFFVNEDKEPALECLAVAADISSGPSGGDGKAKYCCGRRRHTGSPLADLASEREVASQCELFGYGYLING